MTLGTGVWILVTAITFICAATYSVIKGQFLSYHAYVVWEVKEPLSQKKCRLGLCPSHTLYHDHAITEILLLWCKTTTNNQSKSPDLLNRRRVLNSFGHAIWSDSSNGADDCWEVSGHGSTPWIRIPQSTKTGDGCSPHSTIPSVHSNSSLYPEQSVNK